jgi:hypothetical protein
MNEENEEMEENEETGWEPYEEMLDRELGSCVTMAMLPLVENPVARVAWHERLAGIEPGHRRVIDEAMLHYAESGQWPLMEREHAELVFLRVDSALKFLAIARCGELSVSGLRLRPVPRTISDKQALAFLLVDWWHHCGREMWLGYISKGCL